MKPFIVGLAVASLLGSAFASAEVGKGQSLGSSGSSSGSNLVGSGSQYDGRRQDTYGAPGAPVLTDTYSAPSQGPSVGSEWSTFQPVQQQSSASYEPLYSQWVGGSNSQFQPYNQAGNGDFGGVGAQADFNVGFPGQSFLNTALTIVFGLVGFSLLIQLVTKIMAAPFFDDIFGKRSLDAQTLADYTHMAMSAIDKVQDIYGGLKN